MNPNLDRAWRVRCFAKPLEDAARKTPKYYCKSFVQSSKRKVEVGGGESPLEAFNRLFATPLKGDSLKTEISGDDVLRRLSSFLKYEMHKQDVAGAHGTYWFVIGKTSHDLYVTLLVSSAKRRVLVCRAWDSPHKMERGTHRYTVEDEFMAMMDEPDTSDRWRGLCGVVNGQLVWRPGKRLQCTGPPRAPSCRPVRSS